MIKRYSTVVQIDDIRSEITVVLPYEKERFDQIRQCAVIALDNLATKIEQDEQSWVFLLK